MNIVAIRAQCLVILKIVGGLMKLWNANSHN